MESKRSKKTFLIWTLILTLLISMTMLNKPTSAAILGDEQLTVDTVIDLSLVPGSSFTVRIYIWDVEAMFGYAFKIKYNTTVLDAIECGSFDPFTARIRNVTDDAAGSVFLAYTMVPPELYGWYWEGQYPIAWITFNVAANGASVLEVFESEITDIHGHAIITTITNGYFANVAVPHNIAVTDIRVSPTRDVKPSEFVSINVTVADQAPYDETCDLTVYANSTQIGSESVSLVSLRQSIKSFQWDTTSFALGNYVITANASVVPEETYTADNTLTFDDVVVLGTHDLAVVGVAVSPTSVATGDIVEINVTLSNLGNFTESLSATTRYTYLKDTPEGVQPPIKIETKPVTSLAAGTNTTVAFKWNTTSVAFRAPNKVAYLSVEANVSKADEPAVPYETNTGNNWDKMTGNVTVWLTGPAPSFSFSPSTVFENSVVTFDASASFSEGSTIVSYDWNFGDDSTGTGVIATHTYATNGTYTAVLKVTDNKTVTRSTTKQVIVYRRDVAVLSVTPSANQVIVGKSTTVSVTVKNQGDYGSETFNVTLYYDTTVIGKKSTSVAIGASNTISFSWSTTGVSLGSYTLKAVATAVTGETNLSNNELVSDTTVIIVTHNITVTTVTPYPTEVTVGELVSVGVTVANRGNFTESFSVALYYDDTVIQTQNVTNLAPGASKTLTFDWDTTEMEPNTYTLKAVASSVTDEVDKTDNTRLASNSVVVNAVETTTPPIPWEWVAAGIGVAVVAIAVIVYFFKVRKS